MPRRSVDIWPEVSLVADALRRGMQVFDIGRRWRMVSETDVYVLYLRNDGGWLRRETFPTAPNGAWEILRRGYGVVYWDETEDCGA